MAAPSSPIRVEWGGPNGNLGAVRGPGGRVIWVRYLPREPRAPKVPRPARIDELPTSAAFAEMVAALSDGVRRPWRIRIVGARARVRCGVCRRVEATGRPPMALVTAVGTVRRRSGAVTQIYRAASPGDHPPGDVGAGDRWSASPSRYFNGTGTGFGIFVWYLRGGVRRERYPGVAAWGGLSETYSESARPGSGPRRVPGPSFATCELAARLRASAAAVLGRRAPAAIYYAALD